MKRTPKGWLACVALLVVACVSSEGVSSDSEVDAALDAGVDAAVDARPPPPSCTPATCEDEEEAPPWGCPSACEPGCAGDTVCCDDGSCLSRAFDDCSEGCDVEPTLRLSGQALPPGITGTEVCNRGTQSADATGWRLILSEDDEVLCEAELERTLERCECVVVICHIPMSEWYARERTISLRAELDVGETLECGNPLGRVQEVDVRYVEI